MSSVLPTAGRRRSPLERAVVALAALAALALLLAGPAFAALPLVIAIAGVEIRAAFRAATTPPSPAAVRIVDETEIAAPIARCDDRHEGRADKVLGTRGRVEPGRLQR